MFGLQSLSFRRTECPFPPRGLWFSVTLAYRYVSLTDFVLPTLPASSLTIDGGHPGSFVVQIPQVMLALALAVPAISNAASETSKVRIFSSSPLAIGMILLA